MEQYKINGFGTLMKLITLDFITTYNRFISAYDNQQDIYVSILNDDIVSATNMYVYFDVEPAWSDNWKNVL